MKNIKKLSKILFLFIICFGFGINAKAELTAGGTQASSDLYDQVCIYKDDENTVSLQIDVNYYANAVIKKYKNHNVIGTAGGNNESVQNWKNLKSIYENKRKKAIENSECENGTCPQICPSYIFVGKKGLGGLFSGQLGYTVYANYTKDNINAKANGFSNYVILESSGSRKADVTQGEAQSGKTESNSGSGYQDNKQNGSNPSTTDPITSCDSLPNTMKLVKKIYNFLKYMIPVIIIGLGMLDFIKAITSDDEKVFKEAWNKLMKRIIVGVIILILPVILEFLINISGVINEEGLDKNNLFCIFTK